MAGVRNLKKDAKADPDFNQSSKMLNIACDAFFLIIINNCKRHALEVDDVPPILCSKFNITLRVKNSLTIITFFFVTES